MFLSSSVSSLSSSFSLPDYNLMQCNETGDLGLDYYADGQIDYITEFGITKTNWDYCDNDDALIEFYCKDKKAIMANPYNCESESKVCYDDMCVTKVADKKCVDPDNLDIFNAGITTYNDILGLSGYYADNCKGANIVSEAVCDSDKDPDFIKLECPEGFVCNANEEGQGACVEGNVTCFDSDGGFNLEDGGYIEQMVGNKVEGYWDKCIEGTDNKFLVEYYCKGDTVESEKVNCSETGKKCVDFGTIDQPDAVCK